MLLVLKYTYFAQFY